MTLPPDIEHRLIGDIYDAALEPRLWSTVLEVLTTHLDAHIANLVVGDRLNPDYLIVHAHGATEEQIRLYSEGGFAELDMKLAKEWNTRGGVPLGMASTNERAFGGLDNFRKAAGRLYDEFYAKAGVLHQLGGMLELSDFRYSLIGLTRGPQDRPFSDDDIAVAARIMSHTRRALQIHRQLCTLRIDNTRLYRMLDRLVAGVLLLDADGGVRFANPAAERLLRDSGVLKMGQRRQLIASDAARQAELNRLVRGATRIGLRERLATGADTAVGGVLSVGGPVGGVLMLTVTPLSGMSGYEDLASDGIAAGVFVTDPAAPRLLSRRLLERNFLLGARECDACEAFLNVPSPEGMAEALGVSVSTARSHLKNIYAKTGRHSQAELMQLLMGMTLEFEHIR